MKYFIEKVRKHLHIVLVMSSVGQELRENIRCYPSVVNCCTMISFTEWPEEALKKIASE